MKATMQVYKRGEDQPVSESGLDLYDETGNPQLLFADVYIDDLPYRIFVDLDSVPDPNANITATVLVYDGPEKTDDRPEHIRELMNNVPYIRMVTRVGRALMEAIVKRVRNGEVFDDKVNKEAAALAKSVLGQNHPIHENDAEYYALCDSIVDYALRNIEQAFDDSLRKW